jgi:hypothetical protein
MVTAIILIAAYMAGGLLCYTMLKVEHVSEGQPYTYGGRALAIVLSFLSWLWVLVMLIMAWVQRINATGYWDKPVKPEPLKPIRAARRREPINDDDE